MMDALQTLALASVPVALAAIAKLKYASAEKDAKIKKLEAEAMAIKEVFHWNPKFGEVCVACASLFFMTSRHTHTLTAPLQSGITYLESFLIDGPDAC